eukprot:6045026-Alexandrium_andersonii.AAC.1
MSASLVGSEMCIRDRASPKAGKAKRHGEPKQTPANAETNLYPLVFRSVSYTHLTLPTICSV